MFELIFQHCTSAKQVTSTVLCDEKKMIRTILFLMLVATVAFLPANLSADMLIIQPGDIYQSVSVPSTLTVEMIGGEVGTFDINGGTVNVRGGIIDGSSIRVYSGSTFNMYGGRNNGTGEIGSYGGTVNIFGGEAGVVMNGWGGGTVNISGGDWEDMIYAYDGGDINIYGYNFNFDLTGGVYGDGLLTGIWQGGTPFSLNYVDAEHLDLTYQHVVLHEVVPVPSAVILGSLGLTFSGWLLKRKRMI